MKGNPHIDVQFLHVKSNSCSKFSGNSRLATGGQFNVRWIFLPQISGFYYTSSPFVSDKRYWFLCLTPSTPPLRLLLFLLYFAACWWWFLFSTLADGSSVNCKRIRIKKNIPCARILHCYVINFCTMLTHRVFGQCDASVYFVRIGKTGLYLFSNIYGPKTCPFDNLLFVVVYRCFPIFWVL